jgi:hypothetical protein
MITPSSSKLINLKIKNLGISSAEFNKLSFGRQIEYFNLIEKFKQSPETKKVWFSQKRISNSKALKEFKKLYQPKEFYYSTHDSQNHKDDSFEIFYRV